MKSQVSQPVIVGVIVIIVLIVAVIGWKVFAPGGGGAPSGGGTKDSAAREAHFKEHPGDRAVYEGMNKGAKPAPAGGSTTNHP